MSKEQVSTAEYRDEIAEADAAIIDAIAMRMEIADELAKAKKASGQGVWDDKVEQAIIARYRGLVSEVSLSAAEAEKIAHVILEISKARQTRIYEGKA
jgi:chorismate mutase